MAEDTTPTGAAQMVFPSAPVTDDPADGKVGTDVLAIILNDRARSAKQAVDLMTRYQKENCELRAERDWLYEVYAKLEEIASALALKFPILYYNWQQDIKYPDDLREALGL